MIRIFRHYVPRSLVALGAFEAMLLFGSVYLSVNLGVLDANPTPKLLVGGVWSKAAGYTLFMMFLMAVMGLYQRGLRDEIRGVLFRLGIAFFIGLFAVELVVALFPSFATGSRAGVTGYVFSALAIALTRSLVYHFSGNEIFKRRVLILGAGPKSEQVERLRRKVDRKDMLLLGYVGLRGEPMTVRQGTIIEKDAPLLEIARRHDADEIVVALDERRGGFPVNEILDCKMNGIRVNDSGTFLEQQTGKINVDALTPSTMIFADGFVQAVVKGYVHRAFDIVVSAGVLLLTWPLMVMTAAAIWIESGGRGPILYRQVRVGRNDKPFGILKFRSMSVDAERDGGARWAAANDNRITRTGAFIRKTRIDELPQMLNVFKGDMSFVGPRPERPEFVQELSEKIPYYELRHRVNPGITGWAQICYPYGASERDAKEKLQYDLYYIKNYSLFLDVTILIQTAQVILWGKGAR